MKWLAGVVLSLSLFLGGCAGPSIPLDTIEDKFAAAEIAFDGTLEAAQKVYPRLSARGQDKLYEILMCLKSSLGAGRVALELKDFAVAEAKAGFVANSIAVLRPVLVELEKLETGDGSINVEFNCPT